MTHEILTNLLGTLDDSRILDIWLGDEDDAEVVFEHPGRGVMLAVVEAVFE